MVKFDFSNKVVLVVAGTKGIGFGIAEAFCKAGANVCICSRDELNVASAFQALSDLGQGQVLALSGDIGELGFLESLVEKTEEHFGNSIDILVNNSGGPPAKAAIDMIRKGAKHIDLKPQVASVRRRQHELVRRAKLVSHSYGVEPNRHVRVFKSR